MRVETRKQEIARLQKEQAADWKAFQRLPKKGSFSGLAISERLEKTQQRLDKLGEEGVRHYTEINIEVGWKPKHCQYLI